MDPSFDALPDGGTELAALLERSGVDHRREGDRFSFLFAGGGCRWQTVCECQDQLVLVYGVHPVPVTAPQRAAELCSELNARVVHGSFFLQEGHIVFRTCAHLVEHVDAQERVALAIEYNAAAIVRVWERLSAGAGGSDVLK